MLSADERRIFADLGAASALDLVDLSDFGNDVLRHAMSARHRDRLETIGSLVDRAEAMTLLLDACREKWRLAKASGPA